MGNIGLKTEAKSCRKCHWCAELSDFDVMNNTRTLVFYCQFPGGNFKKGRLEEPTLEKGCPYFNERYVEEVDD